MHRVDIRGLNVFLLFLLFTEMAFANKVRTENVTLNEQKINYIKNIQFQVTDAQFDGIQQRSAHWKKNDSTVFDVGFSPNTYWLTTKLHNTTRNEEWFLTLDNTRLDFVDFYLLTNDGTQHLLSGDHRPISGQYSSAPTFRFYLPEHQSAQLYIRVKSSASITFTPKIRSSLIYGKYLTEIQQIHVYYLLIMLVFIAFQLIANRQIFCPINLYYVIGLLFAFAYNLFYYGEGNLLFWPDSVALKNRSFFAFAMLSFLYFTLFLQKYLRSSITSPRLHSSLNYYLLFVGISVIIVLLPVTNTIRLVLVLCAAFTIGLLTLIGVIQSIQKNNYWAFGLLFPLLCTTFALFIYSFTFIDVLPSTPFTTRIILWSIPLDAITVSISLLFRHSALRRERDDLLNKLKSLTAPNRTIGTKPCSAEFNSKKPHQKHAEDRLSNVNTHTILTHLMEYLDQDKAFLEPGLHLEKVALSLQVRPDQLSTLINQELNTSFPALLNIKRLNAATEQLKTQPNKSILNIALECGFGSKSSFNRLFKEHFDVTPSLYRKLLNKA